MDHDAPKPQHFPYTLHTTKTLQEFKAAIMARQRTCLIIQLCACACARGRVCAHTRVFFPVHDRTCLCVQFQCMYFLVSAFCMLICTRVILCTRLHEQHQCTGLERKVTRPEQYAYADTFACKGYMYQRCDCPDAKATPVNGTH